MIFKITGKLEEPMNTIQLRLISLLCSFICTIVLCSAALAQNKAAFEILNEKEANVIIPTSFYFAGQSAPTQMRNAVAAKIGKNRMVIVGLVDTSGYSTEISGKYEGFFITDSPIKIGNK